MASQEGQQKIAKELFDKEEQGGEEDSAAQCTRDGPKKLQEERAPKGHGSKGVKKMNEKNAKLKKGTRKEGNGNKGGKGEVVGRSINRQSRR